MQSGRFIVTAVMLLGTGQIVACNRGSHEIPQNAKVKLSAQESAAQERNALALEGNSKITQAITLEKGLSDDFGVVIGGEARIYRGQLIQPREFANRFNWRALSKARRHDVAGRLAQLLQLLNRVLEIDSKSLMTIDNREKLVNMRDSAELYQKKLEEFEKIYGENYDPKEDAEAPPPRARRAEVKKPAAEVDAKKAEIEKVSDVAAEEEGDPFEEL